MFEFLNDLLPIAAATCPTLALTTLAGSVVGPAAPLLALITGAVLGGVAGGTAGGVYTCHVEGSRYLIKYRVPHHVYEHSYTHEYTPVEGYTHHVHPYQYSHSNR
jgi:hypothetical protein